MLSSEDFDEWCEEEKVLVLERQMPYEGLYLIRKSQPTIILNEKLRGIQRQIVAWHEFGHHLLHVPSARFFCFGVMDKAEYQAHLIAACALLPKPLIQSKSVSELQEDYGYPFELISFRARVLNQFKI